MTHYDTECWADYARGLLGPDERAAMGQHLADCDRCRAAFASFDRVARALKADAAFEPPPDVVRAACNLFTRHTPDRVWTLPRVQLRLVLDSLSGPQLAGVRGATRGCRHVLFRVDRTFVDLRLEERRGRPEVVLVGQLLTAAKDAGDGVHLLLLTSGDEVVARASSNEEGEFCLEYVPTGRMALQIPVDGYRRRIEIPLDRLTSARRYGRRGTLPHVKRGPGGGPTNEPA